MASTGVVGADEQAHQTYETINLEFNQFESKKAGDGNL